MVLSAVGVGAAHPCRHIAAAFSSVTINHVNVLRTSLQLPKEARNIQSRVAVPGASPFDHVTAVVCSAAPRVQAAPVRRGGVGGDTSRAGLVRELLGDVDPCVAESCFHPLGRGTGGVAPSCRPRVPCL